MGQNSEKISREIIINKGLESIKDISGTVAIGTGVGKTRLCLIDAKFHYQDKLFLVVGPKLSVKQTWEDEIKKWGFEGINFEFVTYRSLNTKNPKDYAGVYLDECHNILSIHENFLKRFNKRIVGITGSPPTYKKGSKYLLLEKYCPIRFEYLANDAINDQILNKCRFIIHYLDLSERKFFVNNKFPVTEIKAYKYWSDKIVEAIENNESDNTLKKLRVMRMKSMENYPTKMYYVKYLITRIKKKCIIFTPLKSQADFISKHSYHSSNPDSLDNLDKFKKGEINYLSCVNQLSEGINIPGLEVGIITHNYANPTKTIQKIGRLLRLNPDKVSDIHILCFKNTVDESSLDSIFRAYKDQKFVTIYKKHF